METPPDFTLKGHIQRGDAAPWWNQGRHKFAFDDAGGRTIVLAFYGNAGDAAGQAALRALHENHRFVDSGQARFFCVASDARDKTERNVDTVYPSLSFLWDLDGTMHRAYGIASRTWIVLDSLLRVRDVIPFTPDGGAITRLLGLLEALPPPALYLGVEPPVPILLLPDVFEPEFCRHLVGLFDAHGGRETGFMQEVGGKAVESYDAEWKRRRDYNITDPALIEHIKARMARRVGAMLQRAFHFTFTRMERFLVACYSAADGGHFGPHRDDTVKATEHRRFAVSIGLNDDFDGGEVSFPEFSGRGFKVPVGTAVVFSGSLLHQVGKVTRGRRLVFLPFIYDEAGEKIRLANLQYLSRPPDA